MNDRKFAFIICSNSEIFLKECLFYIGKLRVPAGYEVEIMSIADAVSMTGGYNEGMHAGDARYKIYMHQDVFILNKGFLEDIVNIFSSDKNIGMIGMVGSLKMPADGVMWHGYRTGNLYVTKVKNEAYGTYQFRVEDGVYPVEAVDGLLIATSVDIPWREELFDGWDFYDVSQSLEMRRKGYAVVVPEQKIPWCLHDDGLLSLHSYDKYRKICLEEYADFFGDIKAAGLE